MRFRSEAEIFCSLLFALQDPTPVRIILGFFFFLMLFGCFLFAVVAFFFFSPLQVLGKHKPRCGLWFPLCLFVLNTLHRPRPILLCLQLHLGQRPHRPAFPFVLLSRSRRTCFVFRRRLAGGGGFRSVLAEVGLSLSLSLSLLSCLALHAHLRCKEKEGVAYQTAPPVMTMIAFFFFGKRAWGSVPDGPSRTAHAPPTSSRSPSKIEAGRGSGEQLYCPDKCSCVSGGPYCHANACALPL